MTTIAFITTLNPLNEDVGYAGGINAPKKGGGAGFDENSPICLSLTKEVD
jgi:hypothetical protein